ncbi:MAG: rod shape-determining protein MreC [Gaiella sp.]
MPRNRTARSAVLGAAAQRSTPGHLSSRTSAALRRRVALGVLVLLAILLVSVSFGDDENGAVGRLENVASSVLRPFQVAADRVAEPFRDAYRFFDELFGAKGDAERLRAENEELRQKLSRTQLAAAENADLRRLLDFRDGARFPEDFRGLAARVIARPAGFAQSIVVAVGARDGVQVDDPVVTSKGLVGRVTRVADRSARVTLLTDDQSNVSAIDVRSDAPGIIRQGGTARQALVLDRVKKEHNVEIGDTIVTAGWRTPTLSSLFPRGIPIGRVTSVGQTDTDVWKRVLVQPFANFGALDAVLVLVRKDTP